MQTQWEEKTITLAYNKKSNIILVGFMGSGKTVIGRHIARLLDYDFADTDEMIKEVTGLELPQLLHKYGDIRFRSEEKLVIRKLAAKNNQVIACGGSMIPCSESMAMLINNGYFVMLEAAPEVIEGRLVRKNNRLFPAGRPSIIQITKMLGERKECFSDIDYIGIDTGVMSVEEAAEFTVGQYEQYLDL